MQKRFRTRVLPAAAALLLFLALLISIPFLKNRYLFSKVTDTFWKDQLLGDTLSMHYTISQPEDWGLKDYQALLPAYSAAERDASSQQLLDYLSVLSRIDPDRLDAKSQLTYELLQSYFARENSMQDFPYYHEPLSPNSGAQSQLPILLAEYQLNSKRDVSDYLTLLEALSPYLEGLSCYEQEKAEAGLFMSDSSVDKLIAQCSVILNPAELAKGSHFLQTTFAERLDVLCQKEVITDAERSQYLAENDRLLTTVVQPAYEKLADSLFLLKGSGRNAGGLAHHPQGQAYYALLVHQETGSSKSMEQLKQLLLKRFEADCKELQQLMLQSSQPAQQQDALTAASPLDNMQPEEMLSHLQRSMSKDFPAFPSSGSDKSLKDVPATPACTVKAVSDSLAPYTAPAFYLTPPLDNVSSNVIYINHSTTPSGLSLYTTLAHEGYPGHLYQSVYYNLHRENTSLPPVRSLLYYGGYVEGWALYVENLSYGYADSLLAAREQKLSCSLDRLDRDIQLCLYSLLDLSIHYDGASYEKVHSILQRFGIRDPAVTRSIYEYVVEEPANYLKYYIGYLEILSLKEEAQRLWGDSYTDQAFHTFFLEAGPCDFDTLNSLLSQTEGRF